MIMISFLTPNIVDALIWTVPNILSIFIRPYLVRYVHAVHKSYRVRNEALMVNFFLLVGAIGALVIAQSTLMNNSKKGFHVSFSPQFFRLSEFLYAPSDGHLLELHSRCVITSLISLKKHFRNNFT